MNHVEKFYQLPEDQRTQYFLDNKMHVIPSKYFKQYLKSKDEPPEKLYHYMITFTLRPDKVESSESAEEYIVKQFSKRKDTLLISEAHYSKELTKKGVPHWHVAVQTKKPLKKDRFNYYVKLYGNIDVSKTKAQTLEEAINYISKDTLPKQIV